MSPRPRIIADGLGSFRTVKDLGAVRARLLAEALGRHAAQLRGAPFWKRTLIRLRIEREMRAEWDRIYPPGALYACGDSR